MGSPSQGCPFCFALTTHRLPGPMRPRFRCVSKSAGHHSQLSSFRVIILIRGRSLSPPWLPPFPAGRAQPISSFFAAVGHGLSAASARRQRQSFLHRGKTASRDSAAVLHSAGLLVLRRTRHRSRLDLWRPRSETRNLCHPDSQSRTQIQPLTALGAYTRCV